MHKNTFFVILFLAVMAALVLGVNLKQKYGSTTSNSTSVTPSPQTSDETLFEQKNCRIKLTYPQTLKIMESSQSAIFSMTDQNSVVILTCQSEIPRPALPVEKIESIILKSLDGATFSAKLYHSTTAKDGQNIDELIFTHPETKLDVYLGGIGEIYSQIVKSIIVY